MQTKKPNPNQNRKIARLKTLAGTDMCACHPMNQVPCSGACREAHLQGRFVQCGEMYEVELPRRPQRPKRHRPFKPAARSQKDEARQRFVEKRGYES